MRPYFAEQFYNPSAIYGPAREARQAYEDARARLARCLGAKPRDIVLTAGATESINLGLQGIMKAYPGSNMAIGATEHQAVRAVAAQFPHYIIACDNHGVVHPEALKNAVDDQTSLISIGMVNSDIGTRQPMKKLAEAVQRIREDRLARNVAMPLYFHTDGSQAVSEHLQVSRLGVDLMTVSAGKIYGPKQTGLLYVHRRVNLQPVIYGGGQENGLRSGTEDVAGAVGFATALELASSKRRTRDNQVRQSRDIFVKIIKANIANVQFTIPESTSAPHIVHFSLPGIDAERLLFVLEEHGVLAATGAACAARKQTASHALRAIGLSDEAIQGSVRCSFGHTLTYNKVERAAHIMVECVRKLEAL